jgi:predicted N-acetyltransferase YhbS
MAAAGRAGADGGARALIAAAERSRVKPVVGASPEGTALLIRPARPADAAEIDALLDAAFGPGRHARTASLLRAGASPIPGPSLVAHAADGELIGSIQFWPIALVADRAQPLTLLGPLAVATPGIGIGRRLLADSLAAADAAGIDPILLIGDLSYYGPFGFDAAATGGWSLPGPVDPARLLLRQRDPRPLPHVGEVVAAVRAMAPADG